MDEMSLSETDAVELTKEIVAAYVAHDSIRGSEIPELIASVHGALTSLGAQAPAVEKAEPAVPIKKSVTADFIISLEDGKRYKSLKRHLSRRGLTPGAIVRNGICPIITLWWLRTTPPSVLS